MDDLEKYREEITGLPKEKRSADLFSWYEERTTGKKLMLWDTYWTGVRLMHPSGEKTKWISYKRFNLDFSRVRKTK